VISLGEFEDIITNDIKTMLNDMHKRKIDMSGGCVVMGQKRQ